MQHVVAQALSFHQPLDTNMINTHVCNVVPSFQDYIPCIYMRQLTGAATLTLVTFVERVVCIKATSTVIWHHMACMTLSACYVHINISMPLVSENMYNIVIKMLMVMPQICHCSDVPDTWDMTITVILAKLYNVDHMLKQIWRGLIRKYCTAVLSPFLFWNH